jgi:hypothetical protein
MEILAQSVQSVVKALVIPLHMKRQDLLVIIRRSLHTTGHINILSHLFLHVIEHIHDEFLRFFDNLDFLLAGSNNFLGPFVLRPDFLEFEHVGVELHLLLHHFLKGLLILLVVRMDLLLKLGYCALNIFRKN